MRLAASGAILAFPGSVLIVPDTDSASRRRRALLAAACLAAGVLAGCSVTVEDDEAVRAATLADTIAGQPTPDVAQIPSGSDGSANVVANVPQVQEVVRDSATGRTRIAVDTVVAAGEIDSRSRVPTRSELAMLSAEMTMPLPGIRPQELQDSFNDARGSSRKHHALDILAPRGTPVYSSTPGTLMKLHTSAAGGLMVYAADSANRFILMYAHLDRYADGLSEGMHLARGQVIGYVGTTGNAPANTPHLHFAIASPADVKLWWTGVPVDPRALLQKRI